MNKKPTTTDKKFRRRLNQLDNADFDSFATRGGIGIATSHFFQGVRCNGNQKHATIFEDIGRLKSNEEHIRKTLLPLHEKLQKLIADFPVVKCRACKGKAGKRVGLNGWDDCLNCDGLGFFWKNEKKRR